MQKRSIFRVFQCFIYAFLQVISIFRRYFSWQQSKKLYLCNRKNKVRGFKARSFQSNPQSCRQASKNRGVDDKDDDE